MAQSFGDAREEELRLLLKVERDGGLLKTGDFFPEMANRGPLRAMVADLVLTGRLELPFPWAYQPEPERLLSLKANLASGVYDALNFVLGCYPVELALTHPGRVRISELRQALRSDRKRDRTGLLDAASSERVLRLAIFDAGPEQPLAVAYLDANGLKQVNTDFDHDAGNVYLDAYAEAVLSAVGADGEACRLHVAGDEVLVLLPGHDVDAAVRIVRLANAGLVEQELRYRDAVLPKGSLCAGIVVVRDPRVVGAEVQNRADREMKRAKEASGETRPRTPRVAIEGRADLVDL